MMSKLSWLLLLGLVTPAAVSVQTVMFVPVLNAQVLYGSVVGTVTDPSGAGVPRAHVTTTNRATSVVREADADENGHYTITDLPPGNYDHKVKASGLQPPTNTNLVASVNA